MSIFISVLLLAAIAYFILRNKGTKTVLPETLQGSYISILTERVGFYKKLDKEKQSLFEELVLEFLGYVKIEGVGTGISDTDRVLVASSAIIPIFGFPGWKYKNLTNVILYPDTFDQDYQFEGENRSIMGMVGSGYMNGQMLLSRAALLRGFSKASGNENTAIHEFVHLLDKSDGATDGVPENLLAHEYTVPWLKMMHGEMHRIEQGNSDINPYALTNEAEFLAVASEYFFEKPEKMQERHPKLYELLTKIFGQDPGKS
ncbi:MAG TPA: M90 family metallopeptidase [Pedobacter sp.]|uniref:M90 family metallopeptidase n=1 Tax=Pedobacter sp. TaxID=1411316 RepID=UPI002BBF2C77|nr:M90 family metallopeptidase [Pedobacter sp.]HMI04286.1 M90 family metallopeptidase [Pedobacter sp.]